MRERNQAKSGRRRGREICVAWLAALVIPLTSAASPQAGPDASWREVLERIAAKDYDGASLRLLELRRQADFAKASEARFLLGVVLFRQQRWQEAVSELEPAAGEHPLLADYALYLAASAYQNLGLKSQALAALSRLLQEQPDSLLVEQAERERARLYAEAGQLPQAELSYRDYLARAPELGGRREAMLALADVNLKQGNRVDAEALLRQLWLKWPESREAAQAGDLLASMPEASPFTREEQFERALILYRGGHYAQAIGAFSPFLEGGRPVASRARLFSGISRFQLRDYREAIALLSRLSNEASPLRAEALYWIGRSYGRLDEREKAIATWTRLAKTYPRSPWADDSFYLAALNYYEDGKPKLAIEALSRLLRHHPTSEFAEVSLWTRAWINYRQSALSRALEDLRRLENSAQSSSRFRVQALYWRGRILEQLGKEREAAAVYRALRATFGDEYYYLEQARLRLARLAPSTALPASDESFRTADRPPREPVPGAGSPRAAKARLLKELNLREEAAEEYWALIRRVVDDPTVLHEACSAFIDLGRIEKSLWIAKRLLRPLYLQSRPAEPVPGYWDFLYPLGYWELVKAQSARHALDPYLVIAVIREESAFGERAVSRAGAVGLMQVLPKTADQLIKAAGGSGERPNLESPAANVGLGTRYLAQMLEEFKGNWTQALAAYNAGPHHVRRWLDTRGYRSDDEFIEEIPFGETQQYVKRVLGSYYRYRAQYSGFEQTARSGSE
jgi:soluble lytic murein transglycosylase